MKRKIITLINTLLLLTLFSATHAQQVDNQLWGTWEMQSAKQTTFQNGENRGTTNLQKTDLMKENARVPQDLFLRLCFFDNNVGACVAGKESSRYLNINEKGTFTTSGNSLTVALTKVLAGKEEQVIHKLEYSIRGDELTINYMLPNPTDASISYRYEMTFKQTSEE